MSWGLANPMVIPPCPDAFWDVEAACVVAPFPVLPVGALADVHAASVNDALTASVASAPSLTFTCDPLIFGIRQQ